MSDSELRLRLLGMTLLLVFVACLSSGCASEQAFKDGLNQLDHEKFDDAVESFRKAHNLWPENEKYFKEWCSATEKAVQHHMRKAAAQFNQRMLGRALEHADKALEYCDLGGKPIPGKSSKGCPTACGVPKGSKDHPHTHTLRGVIAVDETELTELRAKVARAIADATERVHAGEAQMDAGAWDDAVATLRHATQLDRSSERAMHLLDAAIEGAVKQHLALASEHLRNEAWDSCRKECELVDSYRRGQPESQALRKSANDRQKARALQSQAAQAVEHREYLTAVRLLEEATLLWPEDTSIAAALVGAKNVAADALLVEARSQMAARAYSAAVCLLDKGKSLVPARADILAAVAEAQSAWAESLLDQARDLFAGGRNELAWVCAARACAVCPEHLPARQDFDRYGASIRAELRCAIGVLPISPGGVAPMETRRVCEMITTALVAQAPSHLHIVERSRLSDVLTERDLARTDLLDSAALQRVASRLSNADLLLLVSTTTRSNDGQEVERWGSVTYVAGTKLVANPAYAQAQIAVNQAHQELQDARAAELGTSLVGALLGQTGKPGAQLLGAGARGLGGIGAQQAAEKYNNAVAQLNQTPQLIEAPDERVYQFPVCRITRKATVTASMRLVDVATGEVLWNQNSLTHTVTQSDTYVRPEPQYGVPGKQALLSTAEQLYAEACERLQDEVRRACQALLCRRSDAYLARARSASHPAEGTAHRVHYLFDPGPQPSAGAINDAIAAVFEGDFDDMRRDRGRLFVAERLALPNGAAPDVHQEAGDVSKSPQPAQQGPSSQPVAAQTSRTPQALRITLYDKRKRDKHEAFGLVFDVDDVSKDGVDIRVSVPGTKGPKFQDYRVGREFDAYHVRVRIIECEPKYGRAVIDVWEAR